MRAKVTVAFKDGVLDPEAQAIERALADLGFAGVRRVRRRKVFEIELATSDPAVAQAELQSMADRLLANPVIETYAVEVER